MTYLTIGYTDRIIVVNVIVAVSGNQFIFKMFSHDVNTKISP